MRAISLLGAAVALAAVAALVPGRGTLAQEKSVAKVNGKSISEADVRLAEAEIGPELNSVPEGTRRRVLIEYLIENQLFADAAEEQKMASGPAYEERLQYWRRRALRDLFFDRGVKDAVKEADAKAFYDQQVGALKSEEEVHARHILVESNEKAGEIFDKLKNGASFEELAKEHSKDPGSKDTGGDLGYFGKGQMVPQFEEAAFKTNKGEVAQPFESQFGWHVLKVEDKRLRAPPTFDSVKERILASMLNQKAQQVVGELRGKAQIEYLDPEIKKSVEAEKANAAAKK